MRISRLMMVLPVLFGLVACGGDEPKPAVPGSEPEFTTQRMPGPVDPNAPLPPGHPPVGGMPMAQPGNGAMPAGHPTIDSGAAAGMAGMGGAAGPAPVTWKVPEGWAQTRPSSSMRIAQFVVGEVAGEALECKVFGGIGGTAEQNVARWLGQFSAGPDGAAVKDVAQIRDTEVNGLAIKRLDVTGTYGGGMAAGATPDAKPAGLFRMLAVMVEGAGAPVQILLVGPADIVGENVSKFDELVRSLAPAPR